MLCFQHMNFWETQPNIPGGDRSISMFLVSRTANAFGFPWAFLGVWKSFSLFIAFTVNFLFFERVSVKAAPFWLGWSLCLLPNCQFFEKFCAPENVSQSRIVWPGLELLVGNYFFLEFWRCFFSCLLVLSTTVGKLRTTWIPDPS